MSVLTLEAKLERTESSTPWGFRMQGGKDFSRPLTIQKVNPGSLAAKCGLQEGDTILKIGNIKTDSLRHKDAQGEIIQSGNHLDLLLQRGGTNNYEMFSTPEINTNWNAPSQGHTPAAVSTSSHSPAPNFNPSPRPFDSSGLTQQTQHMSISQRSQPQPSQTFDPYQKAAEKYAEHEEPLEMTRHQSKSFQYLQNLMEGGKELNTALKPLKSATNPNTNSVAHPPQGPSPTPIGPGSRPGTVKAIVSQRYNNPIGLYSNENASIQLEGQSKYLMDQPDSTG